MELRPNSGVAVERTEADCDLVAFRPLGAEQARAANRTERLHAAVTRPEHTDQLFAGEQTEAFSRDAPLCSAEGTRVFAAA
jgi:hypothetical protein